MKVLMFGWEFPPFNSGGLGVACYGLTKSLSAQGAEITFVVPKAVDADYKFLKLIAANLGKVKLRGIKSIVHGYVTSEEYSQKLLKLRGNEMHHRIYGENLMEEVERYSRKAAEIAAEEQHDVIHVHDWLAFKAGMAAKRTSGKPLVVHVHSTEFDRTGGNGVNQHVYEIERAGMHAADAVVAVSNYTKGKVVRHYGIPAGKVHVVHNAIDSESMPSRHSKKHGKVVLYLGRITLQKGPDYFIDAAKKVLEKEPDTRFIIAGSGDMERVVMEKAAALGITDNVLFTGFLREEELEKAYATASLYVMPSVSEPFGLASLEAAGSRTPVLVSRQSGVSEVFANCLKVDFWDTNQMANKIIAVLRHRELQESLAENAYQEVSGMSWEAPARKCISLYERLLKEEDLKARTPTANAKGVIGW